MTDRYVRNARELDWTENAMGAFCDRLPGIDDEFAINLDVLGKGQPMALYHHEPHQEGFLVLRGECELRVEGETRMLREWDYVHCPPGVVGGGSATYPEDPDPRAAYAEYGKAEQVESPL